MRVGSVCRSFAAIVATGSTTIALTAAPLSSMAAEPNTFFSGTNSVRAFWHEAPLAENQTLDNKAQLWSYIMAQRHTLYHSNLALGMGSLGWTKLAENIGESPPSANADQALAAAFAGSRPHFANMTDPTLTQMGVGVSHAADGTVWVVEEFARLGG